MVRSRWAVSLVFFVNGFLFANYIARLPDIQVIYGLDYRQLGFVLLSSAVGSLLAMPFTGYLIDRYSSRRVTGSALFGVGLIVGLFILSPNYFLLLLAFFFLGACSGITDVAMNAQAVVVEKLMAKSIMASFHAVWSLGMFMGAGVGALFVSFGQPVAFHMGVSALLGISLGFLAMNYLVKDEENGLANTSLFKLPAKVLIGLGIIAFCGMLGEGAMSEWSTNYMRDVLKTGAQLAPIGLVAYSLAMLIGRIYGDRARMYYGDAKLIALSSMVAAIGCLIIVAGWQLFTSVLGFVLAGLGLSVIVPIAYSRAGNTPGIAPGTGISMVTTIGYSGFIVGPPVIGLIADHFGLQVGYAFILLLLVIMFGLSLRL